MDNQRLIIWATFGLLAWMTWQTWVQDNSQPAPDAAPTSTVALPDDADARLRGERGLQGGAVVPVEKMDLFYRIVNSVRATIFYLYKTVFRHVS